MRLFLVAAIALPLLPGQPKDLNRERDADGFGNIKWGMTVAEAKAVFPGLREPERSELDERSVRGTPDPARPYDWQRGNDCFHSDQGRFRPYHPIVLTLALLVQHRKTAFQFLSNNLIQTYGRPNHDDTTHSRRIKEEKEVWVLPSTTITLDWREESVGKFRLLDITYEATDKLLSPFL